MSGDTTSVNPGAISAGSWKQSDFPAPVGSTARTLRPASSGPSTLSWWTRNAVRPKRSLRSSRARGRPPVKVAIGQRKRAPVPSPEPKPCDALPNYPGRPLCPILPVHTEAVAAFDAFHVFGLPRYVLPLVTAGAHEVGLMHYAPGLRPVLPDVHVLPGNAHFDLVHVQHDPGFSRLFDDAVPRASPQTFLFGACTAAPSPTDVGHDLLQFLGAPFPHQHEDCRLRDDQVLRSLERDLHRSLAEEQRVVPHPRLHRQEFDVGAADLPRLIVHACRLGHGRARPGCHDPATLDLPGLDCGGRKVETDVGALLAFFGSDEHAVTDDDQALRGLIRHGLQYTASRPRRPRPRPTRWCGSPAP